MHLRKYNKNQLNQLINDIHLDEGIHNDNISDLVYSLGNVYEFNDLCFILEKSGHSPVFPIGLFSISSMKKYDGSYQYFGGTIGFNLKKLDDSIFAYILQIQGFKSNSYYYWDRDLLKNSIKILSYFDIGLVIPEINKINGYKNPRGVSEIDLKRHKRRLEKRYVDLPLNLGFDKEEDYLIYSI